MRDTGSAYRDRRGDTGGYVSRSDRTHDAAASRPEPRTVPGDPKRPVSRTPELSVAVIVERDECGEFLIRELQRQRVIVRHIWPPPTQLPLQYDVLFCRVASDLPQRVPWVPGEPSSALVLVDDGHDKLDLELIHNCAGHGILHYPPTSRMIQSVLMLARESFLYERRLRGRIDKLDDSLRTMRLVERAKSLLVKLKDISEEEAYGFLRKQAMEKRVTIGTVASTVIDSFELLS